MRTHLIIGLLCAGLLCSQSYAAPAYNAKQASTQAKRLYGGKVVSVNPIKHKPGQFKVKLLLHGGRVKTVTMPTNTQ